MWVTKLLISGVKKAFFAQKRPNLAQNWHFWSIWARPCRLIQCPVVGQLVVVARGLYLARHLFTLYILCILYISLNIFIFLFCIFTSLQIDVIHQLVSRYPEDLHWATSVADIEAARAQGKIASLVCFHTCNDFQTFTLPSHDWC